MATRWARWWRSPPRATRPTTWRCCTGRSVHRRRGGGRGSIFIAADGGGLAAYLDGLRRLRDLDLDVLCPGHGPFVHDPRAKIDEYIEHRLDRERKVVAALDSGIRDRDGLLDAAWDDVDWSAGPYLRHAAGLTLDAYLDKLRDEGRLPDGVPSSQ